MTKVTWLVCTTATLPTSGVLSKAGPGEGKSLSANRAFAEARLVKSKSKEGGPQPLQEVPCCSLTSKRGS